MLDSILAVAWLGSTAAATVAGYLGSRRFVRARLRFVDAIQKPGVPLIATAAAVAVAVPVAMILPVVTITSGILFGAGIGTGVAHGVREIKSGTSAHYLSP